MEQKHICPSCGAPLTADLLKCPYCGGVRRTAAERRHMKEMEGLLNRLAPERADRPAPGPDHEQNMGRFAAAYGQAERQAQRGAEDKLARSRHYAKTVLLPALAVLLLLTAFVNYTIRQRAGQRDAIRNASRYREEIEAMFEEGDYLGLDEFTDTHELLNTTDAEKKYEAVLPQLLTARYYAWTSGWLERYLHDLKTGRDAAGSREKLSGSIVDFYGQAELSRYPGAEPDTARKLEQITADYERLLGDSLGLTGEELETIRTASSGRILRLLTEKEGATHEG